jgi:hypothetical protein
MKHDPSVDRPGICQIKVRGRLDEGWSNWFSGMAVTFERSSAPITTLTGVVADQSALRGILTKIWDLNLALISVHWVETDSSQEEEKR